MIDLCTVRALSFASSFLRNTVKKTPAAPKKHFSINHHFRTPWTVINVHLWLFLSLLSLWFFFIHWGFIIQKYSHNIHNVSRNLWVGSAGETLLGMDGGSPRWAILLWRKRCHICIVVLFDKSMHLIRGDWRVDYMFGFQVFYTNYSKWHFAIVSCYRCGVAWNTGIFHWTVPLYGAYSG